MLVSRPTATGGEELVIVPSAEGEGVTWYSAPSRTICDRIALSGDRGTVAFGHATEGKVYVLTKSGQQPRAIADVSPDGDPRQLRLSEDGKWIAFTASNAFRDGKLGRVHANLYVAATDGSVVYRRTAAAVPGKYLAFDLSLDGKTVTWADELPGGAWIADPSGTGMRRISLASGSLIDLMLDASGSTVYHQVNNAEGVRLYSVKRDGTGLTSVHTAANGTYRFAPVGGQVLLDQFDPKAEPCGTAWLVQGANLVRMYDYSRPRFAGDRAWSADGKVLVRRSPRSPGIQETRIWRAAE
jgi:hypothetical protein